MNRAPPAVRAQLAEPDGHSRPALVQAPALRAALHLRRDDACPASPRPPKPGTGRARESRPPLVAEAHRRATRRSPRPRPRTSPVRRRAGDPSKPRCDAIRDARRRPHGRLHARTSTTGETVAIDADTPYETFSVIKVPIMATVLQRVQEGKLSLTDRDHRCAPTSAASPRACSTRSTPGLQPTVKDLLTLMIIISDNEATDALGDLVGRDAVTRFMAQPGPARHADPLLRPRVGSPLAVAASTRPTRDAERRPHRPLSLREVRRRRGGRGVPPRHRGHRPLLRPQHGARDGPALRADGQRRAGVEGRERRS